MVSRIVFVRYSESEVRYWPKLPVHLKISSHHIPVIKAVHVKPTRKIVHVFLGYSGCDHTRRPSRDKVLKKYIKAM